VIAKRNFDQDSFNFFLFSTQSFLKLWVCVLLKKKEKKDFLNMGLRFVEEKKSCAEKFLKIFLFRLEFS